MKISIKPFKDHFQKFGESNIDIKTFKKNIKNICYINKKRFTTITQKKKTILYIIFVIIVI